MGNAAPVSDEGAPEFFDLPCDNEKVWAGVMNLSKEPRVSTFPELRQRIAVYFDGDLRLSGLKAANSDLQRTGEFDFFGKVLPFIVRWAQQLPALRGLLLGGKLPLLRQNQRKSLTIPRELGVSLLANMLLLTVPPVLHGSLNSVSFAELLCDTSPQEVAKLEMFLHFFARLSEETAMLPGSIRIYRMVGVALQEQEWCQSQQPLLPMEVASEMVGFEENPELAHADFANMFIGGGVLSGGCVQEEIRFAICPELMLSMLVCPCMMEGEAIQICGAEQFSAYEGYAWSLTYGGDHMDSSARGPDGAVLSEVLAMDALDLRSGDDSLFGQLSFPNMLRELNKALAAFTPMDEESLRTHAVVATGNWGCGAFGGCVPLKAVLQWASASQCGRKLKYFPFDSDIGPELFALTQQAVSRGATVGQLVSSLCELRGDAEPTEKRASQCCEGSAVAGRPAPLEIRHPKLHPEHLLARVRSML
mmetsp:Transcript_91040/g.237340  ORF Transcript_91040/g.237340 Transcript_91040/m.237340 type:complete len:476 (-) Transcript_91040:189-1616(-)